MSDTSAKVITVDLPDGGQCNVWVWASGAVEASYRPDHSDGFGAPLPILVEQQS